MVDAPVIHPSDEMLTLPQVAAALGITRATALTWALRGRFKAREIAGRTYVRREDFEAFKRERTGEESRPSQGNTPRRARRRASASTTPERH